MNQETLILVAKLRRLAARQGKAFDVARFVTDAQFAKTVFDDVLNSDDEEMLLTGLSLMKEMGMTLLAPALVPVPTPAPNVDAPAKTQGKTYIGRLR